MADEAAGMLIAGGALGCAVAEMARPGARPPATVTLEAYFERITSERLGALTLKLKDAEMLTSNGTGIDGRARRIVDPGWATMWMKRFGPFRVGRRILIVPPWNRANQKGRVTIVITPARAFGTGHHPTTAGALRAIETRMRTRRIRRALDVGCGSGVLAIAMRLLGAESVVAIDTDPHAVDNARENARLSAGARAIRFSSVPLHRIRGRFDLIAANILTPTLIEMLPELARLLAQDGRLVLGGILASEARELTESFRTRLRLIRRSTNRGWTTLVYAR
jgi:ribosomal protein L11 methyltransferase